MSIKLISFRLRRQGPYLILLSTLNWESVEILLEVLLERFSLSLAEPLQSRWALQN